MRRIPMTIAAAALTIGALAAAAPAPTAHARQPSHATIVDSQTPAPARVQPLDCVGTTGAMGCGPGWFWRDGWRGWSCYPC
jgi:hypothetical protein